VGCRKVACWPLANWSSEVSQNGSIVLQLAQLCWSEYFFNTWACLVTLVKAEKLAKFPDSQEACNGLSLLACRRA